MTSLRSLRSGLHPSQWATERATRIAEILVGDKAFEASSQPLIERAANLLDAERADLYEQLLTEIRESAARKIREH